MYTIFQKKAKALICILVSKATGTFLKKKGFKLSKVKNGFNETIKTYTKGLTIVIVIAKYTSFKSGAICIATS